MTFSTHARLRLIDVVEADFAMNIRWHKWIDIHHRIIILCPSLLIVVCLVLLFLHPLIHIEFYNF